MDTQASVHLVARREVKGRSAGFIDTLHILSHLRLFDALHKL